MASAIRFEIVRIEKPDDVNVILGQSHFIKTVEDVHESLAQAGSHVAFGIAFCEASGQRLIRRSGTDGALVESAVRNAQAIGAGHSFVVMLRNAFPVSVLNAIKQVPEVCGVFCASANAVEVIIGVTDQGRSILGVVDGEPPVGIETERDVDERKGLLRRIGYKL